jgi:hypothetical protein
MTLARSHPGNPVRQSTETPKVLSLSHSSRPMGIVVAASRGTGKSRLLGRKLVRADYVFGIPQVVFDPVGATIDNFLDKTYRFLTHVPKSQQRKFWERIVYVDMAGTNGVGWPLYYQLGKESLWEVSERYVQCLQMTSPSLLTAQYYGWPPLHKIGVYTGMVLFALGLQIPRAIDLLRQPEPYLAQLQAAPGRFPEVTEAVAFFTKEYLSASRSARERLTTSFLDKIFPFALDEGLQALVGAAKPGINWDEVARKRQTVLLDFRNVHNQELRRFLLLWSFLYLFEWIKRRGRNPAPFAVCFDEFAHITRSGKAGSDGNNPLADLFDEFINVYMRNHNI